MSRRKSTPIEPATVGEKPSPQTGAASAGQSGDLQGLPWREESDSESVQELIEEGQFYEASVVDAVENAPSAEDGPLRPHRRREDDLRPEYADQPQDEPRE
jgi:hypothetical protein